MRTYVSKPPEPEIVLDRTLLDQPGIRAVMLSVKITDLVSTKDWRYRDLGAIKYHEHSLVTKSTQYPYPFEVVPVLNLGYLESRTIEEGVEQPTDLDRGYVRLIGIAFNQCVREDKEGPMTRVIYEVIGVENGKMVNYTVTDTYVEIDLLNPQFTFVSKMV